MSQRPESDRTKIEELERSGSLNSALALALDAWRDASLSESARDELRQRIVDLRARAPRAVWCSPAPGAGWFVGALAVNRSGTEAAIGAWSLQLKDLETDSTRTVECGRDTIALAYDPTGKRIARLDQTGALSIVDLVREVESRFGQVELGKRPHHTRLHWTPCGTVIAVGLESGELERWRIAERRRTVSYAPWNVEGDWLAFSRRGTALLERRREFLEVDLVTRRVRESYAFPAVPVEFPIAFENGILAHLERGRERRWRAWDLRAERSVLDTDGQTIPTYYCSLSPTGRFLVAGPAHSFQPLCAWDLSSGTERIRRPMGANRALVEFTNDENFVQSSHDDQTLHVWSLATGDEVHRVLGHSGEVHDIAFSPGGETLASTSNDGTVRVWSTSTGCEISHYRGCDPLSAFVGYVDEDTVLLLSSQGLLRFEYTTGSTTPTTARWRRRRDRDRSIPRPTIWMSLSGDGRWLATLNGVQDLESGEESRLDLDGDAMSEAASCVACSPDGRWVVLSSNRHPTVSVFDARTGARVRSLDAEDTVHAHAFHPDSGNLYLVVRRPEIFATSQWDVTTGELRGERAHPSEGPLCLSFSPSGDRYALGDQRGDLWIHRTDDDSVLACIDAHLDWVRSVKFSPDGRSLASCSDDNTVRLWSLPPFDPVRWNDADLDAWRLETGLTPCDDGRLSASRRSGKRLPEHPTRGAVRAVTPPRLPPLDGPFEANGPER
ncbi:MAG: hypothetical protein KDC38_13930 [Planctomycetes bacterium]|nr:hypothetical protein [Planctomycetota bacterium]